MVNVKYTEDHEWIRIEGDVGTIGITNFAQEQLGDIVFVELPEVGGSFKIGEQVAVVESVKAASEIYAPVSGDILESNDSLSKAPETVNADAEGDGWFFKIQISNLSELESLLDKTAYKTFLS